jgi:glycolate oxidase
VPRIVASGIGPLILEYIDAFTMDTMSQSLGVDVGVPADVRQQTQAYLVVMVEQTTEARLDEDVADVAGQLHDLGALDVYVLPPTAATSLIEAREKAFWLAKAAGADDIVDVVVPRASIAAFVTKVGEIADAHGTFVVGCGHAGDGNVHLSVFQPDADVRSATVRSLFEAGMALGGVLSGEHGVGRTKRPYFLDLEDPVKLALLRRIKAAFDPDGILNPGVVL